MPRPVCLFTGQWADLPIDTVAAKAKSFGYDGLELACWGDHFDVAAAGDEAWCKRHWELLADHGLAASRSATTSSARPCATRSMRGTARSCPRPCGATAIPRAC